MPPLCGAQKWSGETLYPEEAVGYRHGCAYPAGAACCSSRLFQTLQVGKPSSDPSVEKGQEGSSNRALLPGGEGGCV